jgi:hypothetical protein
MTEPLPPELEHMVQQLCGPAGGADMACLVKQRAARQLQSYLHVLRLRLQKHHTSAESQRTEHDSMHFVQHLRQFQDNEQTETGGVQR